MYTHSKEESKQQLKAPGGAPLASEEKTAKLQGGAPLTSEEKTVNPRG